MKKVEMWVRLSNDAEPDETKRYNEFRRSIPVHELDKTLGWVFGNGDRFNYPSQEYRWNQALRDLLKIPNEFSGWTIANSSHHHLEIDNSVRNWQVAHIGEHWSFFHCPDGFITEYQHVPIQEGCTITPGGGIKCSFETYTLESNPNWNSDKRPQEWPWVLLNPRAWIALMQFDEVMARGDAKPLTILLRSGYPTKGTALQLKGDLELVIRMFTEALTGDRF